MNKHKGSNAERELLHMFFDKTWAALRVAGSGSTKELSCDLIAGKEGKKYVIEVKSSKKDSIYISKEQIQNLMILSEIFGLKPVIATRFNYEGWLFIDPKHLKDTGKYFSVSLENARTNGQKFSQFFEA